MDTYELSHSDEPANIIERLAAMPDYRRELHLRYMNPKPDSAALDRAVATAEAASIKADAASSMRWIYFIQASDGAIKIGIAGDPKARLAALQIGHSEPLRLLVKCRGGVALEQTYHTRFAAHRKLGEWFAPHPDILAEIARLSPSPVEEQSA